MNTPGERMSAGESMRRIAKHPMFHAALVVLLAAATVFPWLGTPSLWDNDEGANAGCAREMAEIDGWIVPTFNWELRTAKPIFLYWLLRISYEAFGINEFASRLPSAIAYILTCLITWDLGRRMFDPLVGFVAGIIAITNLELIFHGRFCSPDAVLLMFLTLYLWALYAGTKDGRRWWFVPCAAASALATLTKGPIIGLGLVGFAAGTWFAWNRDLARLWDRRWIGACLAWAVIAIPWYAWVASETNGEWPTGFFLKENLERGSTPKEGHSGGPWFYPAMICVFAAPWSSFLAITAIRSWNGCRPPRLRIFVHLLSIGRWIAHQLSLDAGWTKLIQWVIGSKEETPREELKFREYRLLVVWLLTFLVVFSAAATKLPHYIAPLYPALAILIAATVVDWMRGTVAWPRWAVVGAALGFIATGMVLLAGMLFIGAWPRFGWEFPDVPSFPGLEYWSWIGLLPIFGAVAFLRFQSIRPRAVAALCVASLALTILAAGYPLVIVDRRKAVKELVAESGARMLDREAVIAGYQYVQPSVSFYSARAVREVFEEAKEIDQLLASPIPVFLFVKADSWEAIASQIRAPYRIAARRYDFYKNRDILVVTNVGVTR